MICLSSELAGRRPDDPRGCVGDAAWPGAVGPAPPLRSGDSHWGIVFLKGGCTENTASTRPPGILALFGFCGE